jgi:hypothetical protein
MAILSNGQFIEARFLSSRKDLIEAIWHDTDNDRYNKIIIPSDLEHPDYQKLMDQFTTDEIATMTDQYSKKVQEDFNENVKQIALDYGLIYDPDAADQKDRLVLDNIFEPKDDDASTDLLFNIKLKIFELEEVLNSDDAVLKKELREATTPIQAFYIAGKFLYE